MFATSAVALALAAAVAYAQDLSVQTPSLAQCANSVINFSGGSGPYYVAILQGQDPCDQDAIQEFFDVNENTVSYTPVLPSNSQVFVYVSDSNGAEAWSNSITIGDGDSSCLGTPTPDQEASPNPPTDNTPTEDTQTNNPSTYNPPADDIPVEEQTTDNTTTDDADTSYQSPSEDDASDASDASNASDDASPSSSSAAPTDTAYSAPYNPATPSSTASIATKDSSATVQSTNNGNKDTTPANANDKTGGATGLAVRAVTSLCAVLVVSLGLF